MIEIDDDVPIPPAEASVYRKYPLRNMQVGQSFLGPNKAAVAAHAFGTRNGMKFASRKEGDGRRIWRIA